MGFNSNIPSEANQLVESTELPDIDDKSLFEDRLEERLKKISSVMNTKQGGLYTLEEKIAFKTIFTTDDPQSTRNVYRKSFDLVDLNDGNIGAGATVNFAHGITTLGDTMMLYVSCVTTDLEYFMSVYPDIYADSDNINFTNPHSSALTSAIAVFEYTKN